MDVLKPELIWVEGRCYRVYDYTKRSNKPGSSYEEDDYQANCIADESYDIDIEIIPHGSAKYKHIFHVPKAFFPFIIGSKGAVRKRLEQETKTSIQVPKLGQDGGDIVIIGPERSGIISARHRINLLVEASRKKIPVTHFLAIPMNEEEIIKNFCSFKDDVLNNCGKTARGVDESIFQSPQRLHITVTLFVLLDEIERRQTVEVLQTCKQEVIDPILKNHGPITIQVKGVECMNDDPAEVRVLYGKISSDDNVLQDLLNKITNYFVDTGFLKQDSENVKMHMTLMNMKFKNKEDEKYKRSDTFDATYILSAHRDTFFGTTVLKSLCLCQRHTTDNDGFYQTTAKLTLQQE